MDEPISQNQSHVETDRVNNELLARTVLDEQGYGRRIYDLNSDVSISFRGLLELPTIPASELGAATPILVTTDEAAPQLDAAEFDAYLETHHDNGPAKQHLIANATPIGVIDLAQRLQGDIGPDPMLKSVRDNMLAGTYGESENSLLDMMSAALFTEPNEASAKAMSDGLMDVVLALNGDKAKRDELAQKNKILEAHEKHLVIKELGEDSLRLVFEHQPVAPELIEQANGLVLVRTSNNEPAIDANGTVSIIPAANTTRTMGRKFYPRQTTHFTLNHLVMSHVGGNFKDRPYTVVAPLDSALEANGRPSVLLAIDTFFTSGPGEQVILPKSRILEPKPNQHELMLEDGITRRFKSTNFTADDVARITEACNEGVFSTLYPHGTQSLDREIVVIAKELGLVTHSGRRQVARYDANGQIVGLDTQQAIAYESIAGKNADELMAMLQTIDENGIEKVLGTLVNGLAVNTTIVDLGGTITQGGDHYDGILDVTGGRVYELAQALDVRSGIHQNTIEYQVEELSSVRINGKAMFQGSNDRYNWKVVNGAAGDALNTLLSNPNCPQRLRRAALEVGLLSVRDEKDMLRNDSVVSNTQIPRPQI